MYKKKVCISFDYTNDKHYRYLFQAWSANPKFHFVMNDKTPNEINSYDISRIKAVLTTKIKSADYLVVIIGKKTNTRHPDYIKIGEKNWQIWEIKKAIELGKKIVAVKTDKSNNTPNVLYSVGAKWSMSVTEISIVNALNSF